VPCAVGLRWLVARDAGRSHWVAPSSCMHSINRLDPITLLASPRCSRPGANTDQSAGCCWGGLETGGGRKVAAPRGRALGKRPNGRMALRQTRVAACRIKESSRCRNALEACGEHDSSCARMPLSVCLCPSGSWAGAGRKGASSRCPVRSGESRYTRFGTSDEG
jgi:hypothetical protein